MDHDPICAVDTQVLSSVDLVYHRRLSYSSAGKSVCGDLQCPAVGNLAIEMVFRQNRYEQWASAKPPGSALSCRACRPGRLPLSLAADAQ
jgi:hypothetical protein